MSKKLKADLALLFVTFTWGISFLLTKNELANMGVFNFLAVRFTLAFLLSVIYFNKKLMNPDIKSIKYGILVGFILFSGYAVQTTGLQYTSASKSAFITGISVVLVPLISSAVFKNQIKKEVKFGVVLAFVGLLLMTLTDFNKINIGDFLTFIAAIAFAMHIVTVGILTRKTDSVVFAIVQIGSVGFFSTIATLTLENPTLSLPLYSWLNILFLAFFCTALAFILQSIAQRYTTSTHTALIYSAEPVFAGMFGYLVAGELLGLRGLFGAGLILSGMLMAELEFKKLRKVKNV